ncbi:TRAP transporter large permease subunit [Siculibacillus lacustris]|uniref:TRAP transporter large permease subunit n=1 Tax=Siculibacillus lacustris TaxID=1549641 RepID=A0A4Q9VY70_9HYPH|nr:TRAP transporter large permease subunit [Siculibacillus lacustris]TBW40925.1 TRAP transporter large permease subunit [Siculibacillus lacustris]
MAAFVAHNIAPLMFASLVLFLLLGYPVAFSLAGCGLFFFFVGVELAPFSHGNIHLDWVLLQTLPERIYGVMNNDVLLAIPFFTFMGLVLERSGMAEDLLDTIGQLFGGIRGGLAYAVIFVGALLAATTGVVAASVISMGLISLPIMLRYGYDRRLASGVIAASGTLAQIIPPSLVLIVMADQLGADVGAMYEGAFVPGLVLAALYAFYVFLVTVIFPKAAPGLPPDAIGFKETDPKIALRLGRINAAAIATGLAAAAVGFGPGLRTAIVDGFSSGTIGGSLSAAILAAIVVLALLFLVRLARVLAGADESRGILSLALLVGISAAVGVGTMSRSGLKGGPDFVILSMSVGVAFSFAIACLNWVCDRFLGFRFLSRLAQQVTFVMVPPLSLIFLVLGTIFIGVATPTEGGAMGAAGAMLLAAMKRWIDHDPKRFNAAIVRQATESTAKLSAFVVFILVGARVFSLTFYGVNGHVWVEEILASLPGGLYGFLIVVNLAVFLLAFFLDFFELAFIIIPLIKPAAEKVFTMDPTALAIAHSFNLNSPEDIAKTMIIWFGVMLGVNMQTSFMHPPFGFALFYLRSVAPRIPYTDKITGRTMAPIKTSEIYWGAVPFVVIQLIMVTLVMTVPGMVIGAKEAVNAVDQQKALDQLNTLPGLDIPGLDLGQPPKF